MVVHGKITCGKIYIEWKIINILLNIRQNSSMNSTSFNFLDSSWHLRINILRRDEKHPAFELCLISEVFTNINNINLTLGIKDSDPEIKYEAHNVSFTPQETIWLSHKSADEHPKLLNKYILENTLTIYFQATANDSFASTGKNMGSQCSPLYSTTALSRDLQGLLLNENDSDVIIEVQGKIFKAHKVILKSRSSVFAAMFEHDMKEKNRDIINVDDCDPNIFCNFLQCIYTGTIDNLLPDNATNLYRLADKYEILDIKEECVKLIEEELSVDTACDVILLADMHNDIKLKNYAIEFLVSNIKTVLNTSKWVSFMEKNGVLAAKILEKAFKKVTNIMEEDAAVDAACGILKN